MEQLSSPSQDVLRNVRSMVLSEPSSGSTGQIVIIAQSPGLLTGVTAQSADSVSQPKPRKSRAQCH